jgi:hypothetical protein
MGCSFYLLALCKAKKQRRKKPKPKAARMRKETQGKGWPSAEALRHKLACVRGEKDKTVLMAKGTWFKEKKVPLRNDIGNITKLMNTLISWWDLAIKATTTPKKEKTKQVSSKTAMNIIPIFGSGEKAKQATSNAALLINPRSTPIRVFPTIMEEELTGDIKVSSKHL